jgi:cytochrome c biogenesis protein CcmG, thiol:disulfide interchange protein DsbE
VRVYWPVILAAAALVGLLSYGVAQQSQDTSIDDAVSRGERVPAPVADLPRLGGAGQASLADYRGKVVVLNFWGSWCKPCVEELPLLQRTQERLGGREATVLGVNMQDNTEDAMAFVTRFRLTFPNLRDVDREYARAFAANAYPETFLIDRGGRIAARRRGPVDQRWLDANLAPLL